MYLRKINIKKDGKCHYYWALVESHRTERGPRQRIVSYLGNVDKNDGVCIKDSLDRVDSHQQDFLSEKELPERIAINPRKVRTERHRDFGGVWLGNEPRRVTEEIKKISMVDVVLTTTIGKELKIRTITKPEKETQIPLQKLGWVLPETLTKCLFVVKTSW